MKASLRRFASCCRRSNRSARDGRARTGGQRDRLDPDPLVDPASQIDMVLLKQIVMTMPPRLRDVFVLSRFAHLEYQEIGERLNIPVTTVQWRMIKALEYCAAQLRL